jgi:hypothetical protein
VRNVLILQHEVWIVEAGTLSTRGSGAKLHTNPPHFSYPVQPQASDHAATVGHILFSRYDNLTHFAAEFGGSIDCRRIAARANGVQALNYASSDAIGFY